MANLELPVPAFFDEKKVDKVWRVEYNSRSKDAIEWKKRYSIKPAAQDKTKICLLVIDVQNTFCIPDFELFVLGTPADNIRLAEFIYKNLNLITQICPTLDTHTAMQIFHPIFLVNDNGNNPTPATMISLEEIEKGKWRVNPAVADSIAQGDYLALQNHLKHYAKVLSDGGKYQLIVWPYHAMLGGIGHALVSSIEEALLFHNIARSSQTGFEIKGGNPLTENYSVLRPEVLNDSTGRQIAQKNTKFIKKLLEFDYIIIAGQAKSHCVAWTIEDLLNEILTHDAQLAKKVYLLEDCTSPVIIKGVIDFTDMADKAFERFAKAGMNIVKSVTQVLNWPGFNLN